MSKTRHSAYVHRLVDELRPGAIAQVEALKTGDINAAKELEVFPGEISGFSDALLTLAKELGETVFGTFNDTPLIANPDATSGETLRDYWQYRALIQNPPTIRNMEI